MKVNGVRRAAYAMPLTHPAFPRGPDRFSNTLSRNKVQ
jgi:acetoacetate decarboxylase